MQEEIRQTWLFKQSPQEVWEFLTKPELLEQWLGKTDFQPIVGHKFRFVSPYGNDSFCEVLEVTPFAKLSFSWQKRSAKGNTPFNSKVVWTLVPKENGTELQLVHNGFTALEDLAGHEKGWTTCLKQLEELLNTITS
ncbi:MAG TPA: SRPBCC domain-containing protein [Puia sp.]|nr:SRPBCC domain-containing protein [Puia sp.]